MRSAPLTHAACAQGIRKSYRCGFANGLLFASGNIMAGAGFLFGAWLIKTRLEETYNEDLGLNCRTGGSLLGTEIEECGFTGGSLMIAMFAIQ